MCLAGTAVSVFAGDAMQPDPVDVLAKRGSTLAFRSGETWRQLDTRTGKISPMHPLGLAPDMPCVIGGFTVVRGQVNGADILENYHPPYCSVVDPHTVMMGGKGLPDTIVQWPLSTSAIALDRKQHAVYDESRYFSSDHNYYWVASSITDDKEFPTGQWVLQRYPDGLTVRPPACIATSFETMNNCVFLGTTNGLLKISLPAGVCTLYAQAPRIEGLEGLLRKDINWIHVITGVLQLKGRTLYCGYFDRPGGGTSFIISRDKRSGYMSYLPVPIAGLQQMVPIDGNRIALAGCVLKNYETAEYAYFGGFAVYNLRASSIKVINTEPSSNVTVSSSAVIVERVLGAGVNMALMEREVVKYDPLKIMELERVNEEYGLDEPEKYNGLKAIQDTVLARRAALPDVKPSETVRYVLPQKAVISTEEIPSRVVPITDQSRKTTER